MSKLSALSFWNTNNRAPALSLRRGESGERWAGTAAGRAPREARRCGGRADGRGDVRPRQPTASPDLLWQEPGGQPWEREGGTPRRGRPGRTAAPLPAQVWGGSRSPQPAPCGRGPAEPQSHSLAPAGPTPPPTALFGPAAAAARSPAAAATHRLCRLPTPPALRSDQPPPGLGWAGLGGSTAAVRARPAAPLAPPRTVPAPTARSPDGTSFKRQRRQRAGRGGESVPAGSAFFPVAPEAVPRRAAGGSRP